MAITKLPKKEKSEKKAEDFIKGKTKAGGTTQISLGMPVELLESIDTRAKELSISRAAFIKQSCAIFLERTK